MSCSLNTFQQEAAVLARHVKFEFEYKDVESTMKTMIKEPYFHHVPVMTGGVDHKNVSYPDELVYR